MAPPKNLIEVLADFSNTRVKIVFYQGDGSVIGTWTGGEMHARETAAELLKAADSIKKPEPPSPPLNEPQGKAPYR